MTQSRNVDDRTLAAQAEHALTEEEVAGAMLANRLRLIGLPIIIAFIFLWVDPPIVWFIVGCLLGLMAVSVVTTLIRRTRFYRAWYGYLFVFVDMAIVALAMFGTEIFYDDGFPPQAFLDNRTVVYFFFVLATLALTYSPMLMVWGGLSAAVVWSAGVLWVVLRPESVIDHWSGTPDENVAAMLLPTFVDLYAWQQDVIVLVLTAGVLAAVVWRSRRLVRRQIATARERTNLARYFPPSLVEDLAHRDTPLGAPRASRIAVMFADVVGFTSLAEHESPEQVIGLLRELHARLETAVFEHGGTLDKFLGDGLMATFGTPEPGRDDAARALAAGRAMLDKVDTWNGERRAAGEPAVRLAVGLHAGPVVLGDIGTERRMEFAVIGDTVNIASRLQELTRQHDARLAASGDLIAALEESDRAALARDLRHIGTARLRGRDEATDIWILA